MRERERKRDGRDEHRRERERERFAFAASNQVEIGSKSGPNQRGSEVVASSGVGPAGEVAVAPPESLYTEDFCLQPGLEWKFLLRRTWLGQKLLPLQSPGLSLPC